MGIYGVRQASFNVSGVLEEVGRATEACFGRSLCIA